MTENERITMLGGDLLFCTVGILFVVIGVWLHGDITLPGKFIMTGFAMMSPYCFKMFWKWLLPCLEKKIEGE